MAARHPSRTNRARTVTIAACTLAAGLALAGCAPTTTSSSATGTDSAAAHRPTVLSQYEGVVPCASCAGIRMRLTLYADTPLYHLTEIYLGAGQADSTFESEGPWTTVHGMEGNADAIVYQLDPGDPEHRKSFVVVSDAEIQMLDRDQRPIASDLNYSLLRLPLPPDPLGGRKWMWVALVQGGKRTEVENPESYTIVSPTPGMFAVQADCNRGRGRYKMNGTELTLGPLAMTFAMCAEGSRGEEFARLVGDAVKMQMVGDTLEVGLKGGGEMKMVVGR